MKIDVATKVVPLDALPDVAAAHRAAGRSIVHCHGCFDIVHPGHVRYLQFAQQQADVLIVSLTGDDAIEKGDGARPYIPQELRAENLAAISFVDHVVIADGPTAEPIIAACQPDVYIKGKEYEHSHHAGFLAEKALVEQAGGRVIFSSGDVVFSSTTILDNLAERLNEDGLDDAARLAACCRRWGIDRDWLGRTIGRGFAGRRVAVVGDAVLDRYVFCEAADVAGEAPILTVKPKQERTYLGGAAIVAAHLRAMGARPHLFTTTVADDAASAELLDSLDEMGIEHTHWPIHRTLPHKQRFMVDRQKLLKVDHADTQPIDTKTERAMLGALGELRTQLDAAIFVDFGYGSITTPLLAGALPLLRPHVKTLAGDVSGARRTLLAMNDCDLLTPTERELRSVVGDFDESLPTIAMRVMRQLNVPNLTVTLAERGCVMFHPRNAAPGHWFDSRLRSEYLPTLADRVDDPVGAGDAMLAAATLALSGGATLPQAGYVGSLAAACALATVGNLPVRSEDLLRRAALCGELHVPAAARSA